MTVNFLVNLCVLVPLWQIVIEETNVYACAEGLAKEKGFHSLSEKDIEKIIHESRRVK